ncbi:MAG: sigma-70 family RNA polymerase sigma factor [Phycisphaerae bacterium]|jgi:RNA polymerase sigma-70 factor (ECF subfamily)
MPDMPNEALSDEQLVEQLRAGRSGAADELARRYWPAIVRFCDSYLGDHAGAEDVAQDTFATLTDASKLPEGAIRPWLYKVARNRCLDILRRHQRSPTHDHKIRTGFDAPQRTSGPRTKAARTERQELIRSIISSMPEDYRSVLVLKFYEGLSRDEMAAALGVSEATVKGRLVRASEYLEEQLRKITGSA